MELVDENSYHSRNIINLKNTSPFDSSKKHNKSKALSDVGNLLHAKGNTFSNFKPSYSKPQIKSPKQQTSKKTSALENMNEEFFTCSCSTHDHDDFFYELPDSLQLSKAELDIFATRWSNRAPQHSYDDLDVPLEIIPVSDEVFICDDDSVNLSFINVLNESLMYVPEISVPDVE